jgi:transcription-repair coupling factor (superfamily II helicase)
MQFLLFLDTIVCTMFDLASMSGLDAFAQGLFLERRERTMALLPGSAEAALCLALARSLGRCVALVTDGPQSLADRHQDLATLRPDSPPLYYPPLEAAGRKVAAVDPELSGYRMRALLALQDMRAAADGTPPAVLVTSVQALMQPCLAPQALTGGTLTMALGEERDLDAVTEQLTRLGYVFGSEVVEKGQASLKGGLLDVWPSTEPWPVRMELYGPLVESMRTFDPESQRSQGKLKTLTIPPAQEGGSGADAVPGVSLLAHLPPDTIFVWADEESIRHHAGLQEELAREYGGGGPVCGYDDVVNLAQAMPGAAQLRLSNETGDDLASQALDIRPVQGVFHLPREEIQPDLLERTRHRLFMDLKDRAARGQRVLLYFNSPGSREHFEKEFLATAGGGGRGPAAKAIPNVQIRTGVLSTGFLSDLLGLVVVAEADLYGRRKRLDRRYAPDADRPKPPKHTGMRVSDVADIEAGDLVVHVEHGIGRYLGLNEIVFDDARQEVLTLEYADGARLHVPVSQTHLLSRYVGVARRRVELHRLGGNRWTKEKAAAEKAVVDLASTLLEVQAHRNLLEGFTYPADTPWQREFEASFPYRETADQVTVIEAVKGDMQSKRPMDRLICGDAGYGKTEVAMRAAFKAVMADKQVAVLVPTTVLAQQHFQTFSTRMAPYPVRIEVLSRFVPQSRQHQVLKDLSEGAVDILIGTHGLLQPGVRFRDLGLVIIDEEQRFGVMHKEKLKHLRRLVDVLTMTATPIPRTLYMSMTGARDMSLLQTPPRERMAIETIVAKNEDAVVREAILRELGREGQVFYLHNRILTIEPCRARVERLVPEARVRVAHGQMSSRELAEVMRDFGAGEFDVLLSTTIVESGVDVPRANTILIDRADRFGIADLYQLRGRVGRSNRKAYAYLLLPTHGIVDSDARDRIGAVKKYSGLSSGFNLALRDLEIRGAGNLLGAAQSGHVTAVGFGLYCQLLRRTVARLKGEAPPRLVDVEVRLDCLELSPAGADPGRVAFLPYEFIDDERLRIAAYRRLAEVTSADDVDALQLEWRDRFGPVPASAERLLRIAALRVACALHGISRVETRAGKVMFTKDNDYLMKDGKFPRLQVERTDACLAELMRLAATSGTWSR